MGISLISTKEQRYPSQGDAYRAQIRGHLDGTAPLTKLSARTNVWGIGAIMFELLTHEAVVNYLNDDEWTVNESFVDIPNARNPQYSGALTELIRLCLEPEPWDRPSIKELKLKIETKCQSIVNEYAANPSLQERDRLYYKGSEINQMPPGNWNYWDPGIEYVPRPSETPDRRANPKNPFISTIIYPNFPTSELDGPEEEGEGLQYSTGDESDDNDSDDDSEDQDDDKPEGPQVDRARELVAANPLRIPRGNDVDHPLVISSGIIGNDIDHPLFVSSGVISERGNDADHPLSLSSGVSDESHGSEDQRSSEVGSDESVDSDDSDDSDTRRRRAIKKLPGT